MINNTMLKNTITSLTVCLSVLSGASVAYATQEQLPQKQTTQARPAPVYAPAADYINVSRALFAVGILRPDDPAAIEEYLRINHCGLFEQYGNNDVAWSRIREAQAQDLPLDVPSFDNKLEVVGFLTLGTYDPLVSGFKIQNNILENLTYVNIVEETGGSVDACKGQDYRTFVPRVHPLRLRARLIDPFNLQHIPIAQDDAQALLQDMSTRPIRQLQDERRRVTMVLRLKLGSLDPLNSSAGSGTTNVTAELDELLIYDGPERKKLLLRRDLTKPK